MILLLHKAHGTIMRLRTRTRSAVHLGRLLCPAQCSRPADSISAGLVVAADNRAFAGFNDGAYIRMLDRIAGLPVQWVAVPDVVGDARATLALWEQYELEVRKRDLPAAFVAQDGLDPADIPHGADALFVGGTDTYKLGPGGRAAIAEAHRRRLWVHVGRVNGIGRIAACAELGVHSVDGTQWSRYTSIYLNGGLAACAAPPAVTLPGL